MQNSFVSFAISKTRVPGLTHRIHPWKTTFLNEDLKIQVFVAVYLLTFTVHSHCYYNVSTISMLKTSLELPNCQFIQILYIKN